MRIKTGLALIAVLLLSGCASSKMLVSETQQLAPPTSEMAQVVFLRASSFGGAIQATVFDVSSDEPEFIGISSSKTKLAYTVEPGKHVFMVVSEAADFLEAELDGGKTYYAMITPRMGAWKARFSLHPVRASSGEFQHTSDKFQKWLSNSKFVENTPESKAWFQENKANIRSKQADYWAVWKEKSEEDIKARTLNPNDGI